MKNKRIKIIAFALLLCCLLAASFAFSRFHMRIVDANNQVLADAAAAEEALLKVATLPADSLLAQMREDRGDNIVQLVESVRKESRPDFGEYFTEKVANRYWQMDKESVSLIDPAEIAVDSGVMQTRLLGMSHLSETKKKIKFSYVSWLTTIYGKESPYQV